MKIIIQLYLVKEILSNFHIKYVYHQPQKRIISHSIRTHFLCNPSYSYLICL